MKKSFSLSGHIYHCINFLNKKIVKIACGFAVPNIPHKEQYLPFYSPWEEPDFVQAYKNIQRETLVSPERCYMLLKLLDTTFEVEGEIWECGTYRGGTARAISDRMLQHGITKTIRLFDTFCGMPPTDPAQDLHEAGDFHDTSTDSVREFVGNATFVVLHPGLVPETFFGLERCKICFAHIDLDIYQGVKAAIEFIYPRLSIGGIIVFDDYGFPTCPGAKTAVDEILSERVICLHGGQAMVIKTS